jgi:hypothetical protein
MTPQNPDQIVAAAIGKALSDEKLTVGVIDAAVTAKIADGKMTASDWQALLVPKEAGKPKA